MAFVDQAPDVFAQSPAMQSPAMLPASVGQSPAPSSGTLLIGALGLAALGYVIYRATREEAEAEEEEDVLHIVELYAAGDRSPRRRVSFDSREDAEDYREQQQAYYDRIVIVEES